MDALAYLQRDSEALLDAVTDLRAPVPGCPDWDVGDLVFHVARVHHRWRHVARDAVTTVEGVKAIGRPERPPDERLVAWARDEARALVAALRDLDLEATRWNFSRGPQVGAFIPRRMAHETAVHRWDVESATGTARRLPTDLAADGVDEFLTVFAAGREYDGLEGVLGLYAEDADRSWTVQLTPPHPTVVPASSDPDEVVAETANDLVLWLWGRVEIEGTGKLAGALREHVEGM